MSTHAANPPEQKTCSKCRQVKPLDAFYTYRDKRRGGEPRLMAKCKTCHAAVARAWAEANPEVHRRQDAASKTRHLRKRRLRTYGLTETELATLEAGQQGLCAVCRTDARDALVVDHDHTTGRVRSLLCGPCNLGLGAFRDDPEVLVRAARYLLRHAAWAEQDAAMAGATR